MRRALPLHAVRMACQIQLHGRVVTFCCGAQGHLLAEVRRIGVVRGEVHCSDGSGTMVDVLVPRETSLAQRLEALAVSSAFHASMTRKSLVRR